MLGMLAGAGIDWKVVIVQIMAFVLVFVLLWKVLVKRITAGLAKREEGIRKTFQDIETRQAAVDRQVEEYSRKLKEIEQEAAFKMKEAVSEGQRLKADMETEARRRAEDEVAKAKSLIQIESDQAVVTLRKEATRLAMEQAERILAGAVGSDVQGRLVDRYLQELEKVKTV